MQATEWTKMTGGTKEGFVKPESSSLLEKDDDDDK